MENPIDKSYIVTHYINPSYFYMYNPFLRDDSIIEEVDARISDNIDSVCKKGILCPNLKVGDLVAIGWKEGHKSIRCEIDDIMLLNNKNHYFLFSIDLGTALYTTQSEDMIQIDEELRYLPTPIIGPLSLEILPASPVSTEHSKRKKMELTTNWSEYAVNLFLESILKAKIIEFVPSQTLERHRNIQFGDVKVTNFLDQTFSITEELISNKFAISEKNIKKFKANFDKTDINHIERWNDNSQNGGVLINGERKIVVDYNEEIISRKYQEQLIKHNIFMQRSIVKVLEWKKKIHGFEKCVPDINGRLSYLDMIEALLKQKR